MGQPRSAILQIVETAEALSFIGRGMGMNNFHG